LQVEEQIIDTVLPPKPARTNGHRRHNLQLLLASLQNGTRRLNGGAAIVFTSASGGEGVTHVAKLFAVEMARHTGRRTLVVDAERLQSLGVEDYMQMPWNCHPTNVENLWMLPATRSRKSNSAAKSDLEEIEELPKRSYLMRVPKQDEEVDTALDSVDALRVNFDNILIDCGSLHDSADAAVLASRVDGVVVVVEAGRSRRDEILNAQRTIENAGGKFLGFVLNRRRYPVPEWLYKRL
jgi:MinD-like ATPase involved in chromosome partitioning or flagellar assembly